MGVRVTAGSISGGGGGGASLIHQASVTLTDSEIRTRAEITIAGAPGVGKAISFPAINIGWTLIVRGVFVIAYTNVNAAAAFSFYIGTTGNINATFDGAFSSSGTVADFLVYAPNGDVIWTMGTADQNGFTSTWNDTAQSVNAPLLGKVSNGASGDLTGGDSGNSLTWCLPFFVYDTTLNRLLTTTESGWDEDTRTFT